LLLDFAGLLAESRRGSSADDFSQGGVRSGKDRVCGSKGGEQSAGGVRADAGCRKEADPGPDVVAVDHAAP